MEVKPVQETREKRGKGANGWHEARRGR